MTPKMPELPEPPASFEFAMDFLGPPEDAEVRAYVAALRAYALQVAEACAKECEHVEDSAWALWKATADPTEQGRSLGAQHCAQAIRAQFTAASDPPADPAR